MESPSISQPMSPIRDISVQKSQGPAEEIPAQEKDSKCPLPNEQTHTQEVTPTEEIENEPSASESIKPNYQSEINAIQKHVEDSLLFLNYGKDSKETNNDPENVEKNIGRTVPTNSLKEDVLLNPEQAENKTEYHDKMDGIQAIGDKSSPSDEVQNDTNVVSDYDNVYLEASNIAYSDESMNETSISVEKGQIITEIPEKIEYDMKDNILLTQSEIEDNIEHEIKSPGNVKNNVPIQDTIRETPLSVEQAWIETEAPENVASIQNTSDEGLALNDAQETSVVSEQIYVSVNNVQEPSLITHLLEKREEISVKGSPPLDISITKTDNVLTKNGALSESQKVSVQESFLENQISNKHVKESLPGNTENKVLEPLVKDITDSPKLESFKEDSRSHEHLDANVQPSEIAPVKASIQERPIPAHEIKNLENMVENVDNEFCLDPSQSASMQDNYEETPMLPENEKEIASKQKVVWESAIVSDNTIETFENMVEDVNKVDLESLQIANQQEHVEVSTTTSELEKGIKDPEKINENTDKNVPIRPSEIEVTQEKVKDGAVLSEKNLNPTIFDTNTHENVSVSSEIDVTQENVEDGAVSSEINLNPKILDTYIDKKVEDSVVSSENNLNPKILNTNTDKNVNLEQTEIVPKQKSLCKSPISTDQTRKEPERNIENVIYHSKSAHSGALTAVPIQDQEQERTEKPVENIIYNEKSAHSGSLKVVSIQESVAEKAIIQNYYENLTYNTHSAHSGSLKVVPIQGINEYPPAKRTRMESMWNTNADNSHTMPSNAGPAQESVQETVTASSIPQSSWSSITENTTMDVDSDKSNTAVPTFDTADDGKAFLIKDLTGFMKWCKTNGIFEVNKNNNVPRYVNVVKYSKHNKGVLKITKVPKYFNQIDILELIKQHTELVDPEIASKITSVYVDENSCLLFNTVLVKWSDVDKLYTVKAFMLLKKADLCFDGEKLRIAYDSRQKVEWVDEKPIHKLDEDYLQHKKSQVGAPLARPYIRPFINGQVDFDDPFKFGLSKEFLAHLNVKLPLTTNIFIKNLDLEQDEEKLRQIFSAAGLIRDLRKYPNPDGNWLKVGIQYDHPLEAIQAISMFHQVALYDRTIIVSMTPRKIKDVLPDGFSSIGPGLGHNGKPMLDIRTNIEIAQLKSKYDKELDKLKQKIGAISYKLRSLQSYQLRIEQADAASQKSIMPVQQEPSNAMAALQQNPQTAVTASQQNPQNAMAALSTVIASSIQNNLLGMLGVQPNTTQGFMQHSPNSSAASTNSMNSSKASMNWYAPHTEIWNQSTQSNFSADMQNQVGQSYPPSGFPNVQTASNMQPTADVQPSTTNMQLNHNLHAGVQNQSTYKNMQHGFVQPVYSMQPGPSNMQPGPSNMQPGPSHMPVQYPQSSIAQSDFSNEPQLDSGMYQSLPAPVSANPGAYEYDAYKQNLVSRSDIPSIIAKPQNCDENLPAVQTVLPVTSCQLDVPPPIAKPHKRKPSVKTAFKIKNPNLTPASISKPAGIKFNIPSLKAPAKPIREDIDFAAIPSAAKTQAKASSKAKQATYSKAKLSTAKRKSPDAKPWINKQIKAMRPTSKSPERARSKSPQYDKPKVMRRNSKSPESARSRSPIYNKPKPMRRNSKSPERARSRSPKYDKLRVMRRNSKSPESARSRSPIYNKPKPMRRISKSPERARSRSPKYDKLRARRRDSNSQERSRTKSPKYDKPKDSRRSRDRDNIREKDSKRDYYKATENKVYFNKTTENKVYFNKATENKVYFKYLPPSVKQDDLWDKMREVGRLVEVRSLGNGNAIVAFRYRRDAEICIETYNMAKVDGQTIEVKWLK